MARAELALPPSVEHSLRARIRIPWSDVGAAICAPWKAQEDPGPRRLLAELCGASTIYARLLRIADWQRAQTLANGLSPDVLRRVLDRHAQQCCPVLDVFAQSYHWSFMQVEYATDLVFRSQAILKPLYDHPETPL